MKTGPYKLPDHARQYFGSALNGQWGGVPWNDSRRSAMTFAGLAKDWDPSSAGFQIWMKSGIFLIETDADIDFDGPSDEYNPAELKRMDKYWQPETSLRTISGKSCDSRKFSGVVLPPYFTALGMRLGDICLVCYNGTIRAAQWYDTGPRNKIGEISYALAGALDISNDPTRGNDVRDLITMGFPNSGKRFALPSIDVWEIALNHFAAFTGRRSALKLESNTDYTNCEKEQNNGEETGA